MKFYKHKWNFEKYNHVIYLILNQLYIHMKMFKL
jgi:hypothetical protein